ncbi:YaaC family protein [Metabacillus herbersteinensis]|uniref:YaaC family protein n=2 Tax=Metabacillus herbersteinensis TaxID=283816 RepID=A0ABV6GML6_9BACI
MDLSPWETLRSYHSTETVQRRLQANYHNLSLKNPSGLAYDNSYRFVYFLKHGENFFKQAQSSPTAIQPILLFYGLSQLLKASTLSVDPEYPSTSSVLAHGVSSRKRKKQQYHFLKDEVKVQKNGLFSHVAFHLFHMKHTEFDKYSMDFLLSQVAEMKDLYLFHQNKSILVDIKVENAIMTIPTNIADLYHMTPDRLKEYLLGLNSSLSPLQAEDHKEIISLKVKGPLQPFSCAPYIFQLEKNTYSLPTSRDMLSTIPELLIHYLILYNLSMISRYETDWWYDLLLNTNSDDYPFILRYLEVVKRKIPYYTQLFLQSTLG